MTSPINDHCRRLLEELRKTVAKTQELFHTHLTELPDEGHDSGDEDPNAWKDKDGE